jgi:Nucleotidyl transferase AbiEii toxin, Type IV TA system
MNNWSQLPNSTKINIFRQLSIDTGLSPFAIEKDWWVSRTLETIFAMDIAQQLVFKGGTSLSKAWKLIQRFSEDIDLSIDMDYFVLPKNNWSKSERTKLRKEAGKYSTEVLFERIAVEFTKSGFSDVTFKTIETNESDQDPRVLEIYYPNLVSPNSQYVLPRILLEVSCRSLREPFTSVSMGSIVDEKHAHQPFAHAPFSVQTVNPERTFLEKLFLLHEEFQRPKEKIRTERMSRHIYDIYHLSQAGIASKAIGDKDLYETIVAHRHKFTRISGIDYNLHHPHALHPIPPNQLLNMWKLDYNKMKSEMIYELNPPTFDSLIENLKEIQTLLKTIPWEFELSFNH